MIVVIGIAARAALVPMFGPGLNYLTLYPAVTLASILGGFGPGVLAAVISAIAAGILWSSEGSNPWTNSADWMRTGIFLGCSILIAGVAEGARRSRQKVEERSAALSRLNELLQREAERRAGAEARLRESEDRFRLATASEDIVLFEQDSDLKYTWQYPPRPDTENAIGKTDQLLLPGNEGTQLTETKRRVLKTGEDARTQLRVVWPTEIRYFDIFISAKRDATGSIVGVAGTALDITARKREEEKRQRLAAAVEFSDDAIIGNDLEGRITSWNEGAAKTFGFAAAEIIGQPITLLVPANRHDEEPELLRRVLGGERIDHYETRRQRKDGSVIDVSLTISPIRSDDGKIIGAAKIAREITQRVRREKAARFLTALDAQIRSLEDPAEIIRLASEVTGRHLGAQRCFFGEWNEEKGQIIVAYDWHSGDQPSFAGAHDLSQFGSPGWWERLATGMWINDVTTDPETTAFAAHGVRSCIASGVVRPQTKDGILLTATSDAPRDWSDYELQLLKAVAQRVWPLVERARSEAALRASELQLRLVTDNTPVFLAHLDRDRRYKFVNEPYAQRYGRPAAEFLGRHVSEIVGRDRYQEAQGHIDAAFAGQRTEFEVQSAPTAMGTGWIHVSLTPERAPDGSVAGVLVLITDITARKEAERELERARDEAVAASRAKDDFIAALSHELRTPLNPVLLIASEAADNVLLPSEVRRDFATIRKNVELEARLIDDLLDLTRITKGKLPLDRRVLSIESVLQDAVSVIRGDAAEKRVTVTLDLQTPQVAVNGDAVRLQQVFWNVLKNAVKFTPPGGQIRIHTEQTSKDSWWRVRIEDTGIGMTDAEMGRVFDAFVQGEHAIAGGSHRFGGVGLGLTISRMLVELHGGSIRAVSPGRGQGSTFTIELPTVVAQAAVDGAQSRRMSTPRSLSETATGASRRVLVVEDHGPTREALAGLLRRRNFEVLTAGSLEEARNRLGAGGISLLVSDIGLPDGDGCDLMSELREGYGLKGIAVTGYGRDADVARSARAGFIAHLTKPVRVQALDAALAAAWTSDTAA